MISEGGKNENFNIEESKDRQVEIGDVFDPEKEIGEIKKLPRGEKRAKIAEFREKLAFQKEGIGELQEALEKAIRKNPDAPLDELYDYIIKAAPLFGLTEEQKKLARSVVEKYVEKHKFIKEIREKFPDDIDLYEDFFGRKPWGKIEIVEGPIIICFRVFNIKDFAYLGSMSFIKRRPPTKADIELVEDGGAFIFSEEEIPRFRGVVMVERVEEDFDFPGDSEAKFAHEEQHAINFLFEKPFKNTLAYKQEMEKISTHLKDAENDNERKLIIEQYFRHIRTDFENSAKNEIIAYFQEYEGIMEEGGFEKIFFDLTESYGSYDYYSMERTVIRKYIFKELSKIVGIKYIPLIKSIAEDIFVREYEKTVKDAIDSLKLLQSAKYSKKRIVALMQKEPLRKWRKVADRLPAASIT